MFDEYFSERLKYLRNEKELTQNEVAKKLNISRSAYTYYEMGKTQPSLSGLKKLAEIYDVDLAYLLSDEINYN